VRTRVTKWFEVESGHRLLRHESVCHNVHGHHYRFEVTCESGGLDAVGRVVDFGVIKQVVGGWVNEQFDHTMILEAGDPLIALLEGQSTVRVIPCPPSAENLARLVYEAAVRLLGHVEGLKVVSVRCCETPTCWADCGSDVS
jgi:6-pyruvoyltetrahydropterin/6-carboxytetrahydropterin synthase